MLPRRSLSKKTNNMQATTRYSLDERQELTGLARNLRRAKRQMFLKEVETPQTSVESFRDLVTTAVLSDLVDDTRSSSHSRTSTSEFSHKEIRDAPIRRENSLRSAVLSSEDSPARSLRRAKRQMFLKEVEPQTPVGSFRDLVTSIVIPDLVDEPRSSSPSRPLSMQFSQKKLTDSPNRRENSLKSAVKHLQEGSRAA
ncbi:MAG: hypothetical protein SGBAC_007724 [Bacillariaceae sp.]